MVLLHNDIMAQDFSVLLNECAAWTPEARTAVTARATFDTIFLPDRTALERVVP